MDPDPQDTEHPTPATVPRPVSKDPRQDREVREQRREMIATLLLSKQPYRRIAELVSASLGIQVSVGTVASDVAVLRQRWGARMTEAFGAHVSEQMAYYDGLLRAVAPKALQGEHTAVQDLLAVLDRRSRLLGMDQPDKLLVGAVIQTDDVAAKWASAPREEQLARTEQIMAIVMEAKNLRLPDGPPLQNGNGHQAIDVN